MTLAAIGMLVASAVLHALWNLQGKREQPSPAYFLIANTLGTLAFAWALIESTARHARHLVMVRVEYLGERPLVYMGQRDVAFQARVTLVPIDVGSGTPIEQPTRVRLEYTHLNAQRVVEKELRQPTSRIVQLLAGR